MFGLFSEILEVMSQDNEARLAVLDLKDTVHVNDLHYLVSTVYLNTFVAEFETMIFACDKDGVVEQYHRLYCRHYDTKEEAEAGHAETVASLQAGTLELIND